MAPRARLSAWLTGSIALHALEFAFDDSFTLWLFTSFDLMTGLGYTTSMPRTVLGRMCVVFLVLIGILCIAVITATLCGSSELDATEVWLIGTLLRRKMLSIKHDHSVRMIQRCAKLYHAKVRRRQNNTLQNRMAVRTSRIALNTLIQEFKATRYNSIAGVQVTNIKTLDGLVRNLDAKVTGLGQKVDAMEQRQISVAASE